MSNHKTKEDIQLELKLIKAAQKNPERFGVLYDQYYKQIFLYIYKRIDEEEATADITSVVFMKALMSLPKYKFKGVPFSAWLYRIATNEVNLYFRKNKKQRAINIENYGIEKLIDVFDDESDNGEKSEMVIKAIEYLKELEVQLLEMRFFEDRSFKEIGQILGITENNAKVRTYRVVERLKKIIEENFKIGDE